MVAEGTLFVSVYSSAIPRYYISLHNFTTGEAITALSLPNSFNAIAPEPWMVIGDLLIMPSSFFCNIFAWNLTNLADSDGGYVRCRHLMPHGCPGYSAPLAHHTKRNLSGTHPSALSAVAHPHARAHARTPGSGRRSMQCRRHKWM